MITNDRQYKIAKIQAENFLQLLEGLHHEQNNSENIHPALFKVQRNAIESQSHELTEQIEEYEKLKEGKIAITEVNNLQDLPLTLIKARIASKMTQAELADLVGIKMQQIQRYEAEQYDSASVKTLLKIAEYLKIKINAEVQIKHIEAPEEFDIKNYPFKQMFQRKWFGNFSGSFNEAVLDSKNLLEKFFETVGNQNLQYSLTKKSVRIGSTLNQFALNAWYAQVLRKAKDERLEGVFKKENLDESWLRNLAELSCDKNGPVRAAEYLKRSGIHLIVEPQLEGTFLDGAALFYGKDNPVIALTLRHDRLDNFWFVLFHEIAHIILHLSESLIAIFDDLDIQIDGIEEEADRFALNALIPDAVWKRSLVRFSPSEDTIINQAKTLKVHPALIAGRIRRETGKYYRFNELIGQGEVRKIFLQELKN